MATAARVKAGEAFVAIEALDKTGYVLDRIAKKMSNWSHKMTDLGRRAVIAATIAAIPVALSTKVFASFDTSMRKVEARTVGTASEMSDLRTQAEDLGRTTSYTASQVGELMAVLGQKGFNRQQIRAMTPHVMNLGKGAGEGTEEDLPLAAALTSNALRIFGMQAGESQRVADVLTKAVNSSALSLESLTESFKYLGPLPHKTNMSLEETVATLGMLGNLGIEGSMSGTAIRGMILGLSDATKRANFSKMLQQVTGKTVELVDAAGNMKKPVDILFSMGEALDGVGSAQQLEILGQLFGDRQLVSADAISAGVKSFTELKQMLENAAGTAAKTAKKMDEGPGGAMVRFLSAVEGIQIALGKALGPILVGVTDRISTLITKFAKWIDANQSVVTALVAAVASVGTLGVGLLGLGLALKVVSLGLVGLNAVLAVTKGAMAILLLANPATLAIGGLAAAIVLLGGRASVLAGVAAKFSGMATLLKDAWKGVTSSLASGDMFGAMKIGWLTVKVLWLRGLASLKQAWGGFFRSLTTFWTKFSADLQRITARMVAGIKSIMAHLEPSRLEAKYGLAKFLIRLQEGVDRTGSAGTGAPGTGYSSISQAQRDAATAEAEQRIKELDRMREKDLNDFDKQRELDRIAGELAQRLKEIDQTEQDRLESSRDLLEAEQALAEALQRRKRDDAIAAAFNMPLYGWIGQNWKGGFDHVAKNNRPAGPVSGATTPSRPLEALQGLEKGSLEAAKAFLEAQNGPNSRLEKLAQQQVNTLERIEQNTADPPVEVDVVG